MKIDELLKAKYQDRCDLLSKESQDKYIAFESVSPPAMDINTYYERMLKYAKCDNCVVLATWCYMDRFMNYIHDIKLTILNIHRILSQAVNIALKIWDDMEIIQDKLFCNIVGYRLNEYQYMEQIFLASIRYNCGLYLNTKLVIHNLSILHKHVGLSFSERGV